MKLESRERKKGENGDNGDVRERGEKRETGIKGEREGKRKSLFTLNKQTEINNQIHLIILL